MNGGRGHHEHGDDGEHRERRHRPLGERLDERGAPPGTRERPIGGFDSGGGRVGRPVGDELRRRGERVEQLGGQLGTRRRLVLERGVGERHAGEREDDAGQQQEEREDDAGNGQHDEPDGDGQRAGEQRDDGWAEAPEVETPQRVDVRDEATEEVARSDGGKPGGNERLEPDEQSNAQRRERTERGVVGDQPLEIAEDAPRDAEEPDRDDRDAQLEDRRPQGGPRDQISGGRHQADAGADRERAEHDAERESAHLRTRDARHAHEGMLGADHAVVLGTHG